jgi:shikimate kinase
MTEAKHSERPAPASIFLIGMMASGKSTIGRSLAQALGWPFFDVDREIEASTGVPVSLIFEKEGEAGFRSRETRMMAELTAKTGVVVAMGGGAPMY